MFMIYTYSYVIKKSENNFNNTVFDTNRIDNIIRYII